MLYIYATTEKYETAINRLNEGVMLNAETGEWYDGDRHTTPMPVYYRELVEKALKITA
jgi:hypothetical protein